MIIIINGPRTKKEENVGKQFGLLKSLYINSKFIYIMIDSWLMLLVSCGRKSDFWEVNKFFWIFFH